MVSRSKYRVHCDDIACQHGGVGLEHFGVAVTFRLISETLYTSRYGEEVSVRNTIVLQSVSTVLHEQVVCRKAQ